MKIRIAILAACASTLALAQVDVARAHSVAASESKSRVRIADVGPKPMRVAGGFKISENESPRPQNRVKAPSTNTAAKVKRNEQPAGGLFNTPSLGVEVDGRRKTTSGGGGSSNPTNTAAKVKRNEQPAGGLFNTVITGLEYRR